MRILEGQATLQARTSHDIGIDSINDEIVVPNPFAQAILFFRGGASGQEPPIRIIQGPKTLLNYNENVAVDPIHNEVFTAQFRSDAILVFRRDAGGDVAPIRIIQGPKTQLDRPLRIAVDPVNNLIAVTTIPGVWIFNRTDNGDVAPRWTLAGPKTGLGVLNGSRNVVLYPGGKKIIVGGGRSVGSEEELPPGTATRPFIGVWNYGDNGDIGPWATLTIPQTNKGTSPAMAINPEAKELIMSGAGLKGIFFFHLPEIFQ
ncbi:MAG: hypothetical protein HYX72_03965 [Acidobacteria bacterium]|nr:hypothetical protein [Acidobacteriota bacterium]